MTAEILDRALATLAVDVHAFALCKISDGWRLSMGPQSKTILHYILSGSGTLRTGGGLQIPFSRGRLVIVPPGVSQSIGRDDFGAETPAHHCLTMRDDGLAVVTAGCADPEIVFACGTISASYAGGFSLFAELTQPIVEDLTAHEHIEQGFSLLLAEIAKPAIGSQKLIEAVMTQSLIFVVRQHFERLNVESPLFTCLQDRRLARAIAHVVEHPSAHHTVAGLAAVAGMSRSSFAKRFGQVFARTPIEFVQTVRLQLGARLLATTDFPVKLIAGHLGYASRTYFSNAFRKTYGVDPTAYRINGGARSRAGLG